MQPRSRSAQERYNERPQRALRFHLDSFNSNIPLFPSFPQQQLEQRMPITYPKTNFMSREPMPKAESSELVAMVKMKTAIDELQALATSNQNSSKKHDQLRQAYRRFPNRESQLYGELQQNGEAAAKEETSNEEVNQSMQYYRLENEGLKQQLQQQMSKNLDYFIQIRKLEARNSQLQHEIGILLQKWQTDQSLKGKDQQIRQLQQQVKQQIIINLELQELLLSRKMRPKDINQHHKQSATIKQMKVELVEVNDRHKRQIDSYIKAINQKNEQIHHLQQSLKLIQQKELYVPFTFKKIQQPVNSPPMLEKIPLHSEKASPPYFTSTNPSIQQAQNRKKTDSVSSKEYNCLCLGNLSLKNNEKRMVCKTDRP